MKVGKYLIYFVKLQVRSLHLHRENEMRPTVQFNCYSIDDNTINIARARRSQRVVFSIITEPSSPGPGSGDGMETAWTFM